MARKLRVEVEGGLYHLIARGNDRQDIFHSHEDRQRFLGLLLKEKVRSPFFLYAYCLMTNHIHLLLERQAETIGSIMQRVLGGYSRYYNRRYKHIGHVFQGRHKSILCQSDRYLAELVRYIHLNPVRAGMVTMPEEYPYSSHRAYLGLQPDDLTAVDPVIRLFGSKRESAIEHFKTYVLAETGLVASEAFDSPAEGYILGSEEFVDSTIHRIGDTPRRRSEHRQDRGKPFDAAVLISAVPRNVEFGFSQLVVKNRNIASLTPFYYPPPKLSNSFCRKGPGTELRLPYAGTRNVSIAALTSKRFSSPNASRNFNIISGFSKPATPSSKLRSIRIPHSRDGEKRRILLVPK